jgi:predicted secreted protein
MTKYSAYGMKVYRGTSGAGDLYGQVQSVSGPGLSADTIDVTSHDSTNAWEEHVVGILRSGDVTMDIVWDPADAFYKNAGTGLLADFIARAAITLTLQFPDTATTEWTFSALVTGFEPSAPHDDMLAASVTFKLTGDLTLV